MKQRIRFDCQWASLMCVQLHYVWHFHRWDIVCFHTIMNDFYMFNRNNLVFCWIFNIEMYRKWFALRLFFYLIVWVVWLRLWAMWRNLLLLRNFVFVDSRRHSLSLHLSRSADFAWHMPFRSPITLTHISRVVVSIERFGLFIHRSIRKTCNLNF